MIACDKCDKKYVSQAKLDVHLAKGHPVVAPPEPPDLFVTLHFTRPVEVSINGVHYFGDTVKAPNIQIASEIVRIAREHYGKEILTI